MTKFLLLAQEIANENIQQLIPTFDQIRQPPKSFLEGAWLISMIAITVMIYIIQRLLSLRIETLRNEIKHKFEESHYELLQKDAMIKHLISQNERLSRQIIDERTHMGNKIKELKTELRKVSEPGIDRQSGKQINP